ncbi:MOR1B protein, partial [Formicarius rufipectus]|nr:MOR1B protein [Formicarius rufipectus]
MGDNAVLACSIRPNMTLATWKINPKAAGHCTMAYRPDTDMTNRTSCRKSINWKFRPDQDLTLEIQQVGIAQEGNYTCEVLSTEGNFHMTYHLTVLVPPRLRLYCDDQGSPVCQAVAGKPAAQVSWGLGSNSHLEEEGHDNGTVTVLSRFMACGTNVTTTTCMVFHPAGNWSESIDC